MYNLSLYSSDDLDYKANMIDSLYTRKELLYKCCKIHSKLNKCAFLTSFIKFRSYLKHELIFWYLEHKSKKRR